MKSKFSFFLTINNAFVFADTHSCIAVTIRNYTHVRMNFFLTMTDNVTSLNTNLSPESLCIII